MTTAYLGLALHATSSMLGIMAEDGTYQVDEQFSTAESKIIPHVASVEASETMLAIEANSLSRWAARTLDAYVDRTVVCDPRENYLISRDARISDRADAYNLCRLLRLDELKEVYQAGEDHRAVFKASAQHYLRCRKQQIALKQKIKATVRCWGVLDVGGDRIYKRSGREDDLDRLSNPKVERQLPRPVPDAGHCSRYAVRPVTESLLGKHRRIRLVTEQIEGPGKPPVPNWSP